MANRTIARCPSCDGYGWIADDFTAEQADCDWCAGAGYVYRDTAGVDRPIPASDYGAVADQLEQLERERMREIGYTGEAKRMADQAIRWRDPDRWRSQSEE